MKTVDKNNILATKYKFWLDGLGVKKHPEYTSSNFRFYYDIIANLIWIQHGLCAYTERKLQDCKKFTPAKWNEGKYNKGLRFEFAGQLDHYDNLQKKEYGWAWSNFFLIDSDVNVKAKHEKTPNGILKPDKENFNPCDFLEYDIRLHLFIPKKDLDFDLQKKILEDINYLGLNFEPVTDWRRDYLSPYLNKIKYSKLSIEDASSEIYQFFTAFELSKSQIL